MMALKILSKKNTSSAVSKEEINGMIRQRAYEIYKKRGSAAGNELFDWFAAELEVRKYLGILGKTRRK